MYVRVLFADPEEPLLAVYRRFFSRVGFEVATVGGGAECLARLSHWKPDVLVLEPDMTTGWGERAASSAEAMGIPVVILSRRDRYPIATAVREYHIKPTSMQTLARSIRAAAEQHADSRGKLCVNWYSPSDSRAQSR